MYDTKYTKKILEVRNISGLLTFDKIFEKLISELIISDMSNHIDPSQYGNQRGVSIQHYLINMVHKILEALENNSKGDTFAVVANLIDWENAFPRQCPKLGVESFIQNGVRPALIPVLINYFQDREMSVKWHGCQSVPRKLRGGGPQGATIGLLEYLSQSNHNADCVSESERFKFLDDLSILEIVNLLTIGISSYNVKLQVPNDIPVHNQYIPPEDLKSQNWLNQINDWTIKQKMKINEKKTKCRIFNYTSKYQFTTRLSVNNQPIEVINSTRLLGTILQNTLSWDMNTKEIIRKANARMELLRKVASFCDNLEDLKNIYILFIRSILEQSATVWHSSISEENKSDLERVQKTALKVILDQRYKSYRNALNTLNLESLNDRREKLCLTFAQRTLKHQTMRKMCPVNEKTHEMNARNPSNLKFNLHTLKDPKNHLLFTCKIS